MASSARKLGGGRVLGSGRSLSPAIALQPRNSNLISPSESSVSLSSQVSTQPSTENQDLSSRVSLDHGDPTGANTAANSKLVCPICDEEMVTLLQLNRHLDDTHQNLPTVEQDEVKTWFRTQMVKAKRFQPLAVLNQKLKGLDTFEPNSSPTPPPSSHSHSHSQSVSTPEPLDPSDLVTRAHFQRASPGDACSDPLCPRKPFNPLTNPAINCRCCGRLFCEDHTMYQMKLSRSAAHEPVRGAWCRVCETCYKSREGYNDHVGFSRDHTSAFVSTRRKTVDKNLLEVGRLEKRLTKLTQLLANPPPPEAPEQTPGAAGLLWSLASVGSGPRTAAQHRKQLEQSVVTWEDDASVGRCPFCQQEFASSYGYVAGQRGVRRHHCRLCGRVVCGDSRTACSSEVGLDVAAPCRSPVHPSPSFSHQTPVLINPAAPSPLSEKTPHSPSPSVALNIRMCRKCQHTIFFRRDFALSTSPANPPPSVRAYATLLQFERGIRLMLPKFQALLVALQYVFILFSLHPLLRGASARRDSPVDNVPPDLRGPSGGHCVGLQLDGTLPSATSIRGPSGGHCVGPQLHTHANTHSYRNPTTPPSATQLHDASKIRKRLMEAFSQYSHAARRLRDLPTSSPTQRRLQIAVHAQASAFLHLHMLPLKTLPGVLRHAAAGRELVGTGGSEASSVVSGETEGEERERELRAQLVVLEEQRFMVGQMEKDAARRRKFDEVEMLGGSGRELEGELERVRAELERLGT